MRIPEKIEPKGVSTQGVERNREKAPAGKIEDVKKDDQVTVSDRAKEIARLRGEASKLPEVRTEKVNDIKKAVDSGTYNVKGEAVAAKMLKEALIDSTV